jgi:hypothetical protein
MMLLHKEKIETNEGGGTLGTLVYLCCKKKRFFRSMVSRTNGNTVPRLRGIGGASGQKKTARPELGGVVRGDGLEGAKQPLRRRRTYREP